MLDAVAERDAGRSPWGCELPSQEEFDELKARLDDLEGRLKPSESTLAVTVEDIQAFLKVEDVLAGNPAPISAEETASYLKVRDRLLDELSTRPVILRCGGPAPRPVRFPIVSRSADVSDVLGAMADYARARFRNLGT